MCYCLAAPAYHVISLIKTAEQEFSDCKQCCYRANSNKSLIYVEVLDYHLSGCCKKQNLYYRAWLMRTEHLYKLHAYSKRHVILQFKLVMPYIKKTLTYKLYNKYRYHKYEKCRQYQFHVGRYVFHGFPKKLFHHSVFLSVIVLLNELLLGCSYPQNRAIINDSSVCFVSICFIMYTNFPY